MTTTASYLWRRSSNIDTQSITCAFTQSSLKKFRNFFLISQKGVLIDSNHDDIVDELLSIVEKEWESRDLFTSQKQLFSLQCNNFYILKKSLLTSLTHGRSMSNWENQPFHKKFTDGKSIFIRQNYLPTHYIGISTSKDVKEQIEGAVSKGHIPRYCI